MSGRRLVDTNLIVRHLTQDHPKHAALSGKLFAACDRGDLILLILPAVMAECVFVLESFYKHPRAAIANVLINLISSPGIELDDRSFHVDALRRYAETKLHFVDCIIAAHAVASRLPVASFDAGLGKLRDVRIELDG